MTYKQNLMIAAAVGTMATATITEAAIVTVGSDVFDDGYATSITYDTDALRGTENDRDNPFNALGATDDAFFEIGLGSTVELTFGTRFTSPGNVVEVTFGDPSNFIETALFFVGLAGDAGSFVAINQNPIVNQSAQNGVAFTFAGGPFDTLRITDTSQPPNDNSTTGGFDIESIRITTIPVPASGLLLLSAFGGIAIGRRRRKA